MTPQAAVLRRSRLILVLLACLFFLPFIGAWAIYNFFPDWRPTATTNYGELLLPARPLPPLDLRLADGQPAGVLPSEKWTLVQIGGADCDAACSDRLVLTRQMRLALGEKLSRLQRVYIAPDLAALAAAGQTLASAHKGLRLVVDQGAAGQRASEVFEAKNPLDLYLVDPNGNWLMIYHDTPDTDELQRGMLKDIKKLMRLSSIG